MKSQADPIQPGETDPETGRVAVSVRSFEASELNGDAPAYWLDSPTRELGIDPWRVVDCVNPHGDNGGFILYFENGSTLAVGQDALLFLSPKNAQRFLDSSPLGRLTPFVHGLGKAVLQEAKKDRAALVAEIAALRHGAHASQVRVRELEAALTRVKESTRIDDPQGLYDTACNALGLHPLPSAAGSVQSPTRDGSVRESNGYVTHGG